MFPRAQALVKFWTDAGFKAWFSKNDDFDKALREGFAAEHEAAAAGQLEDWLTTPESALALILLLDQYPRNSFRGTPRMFATDARARHYADLAMAAGHDAKYPPNLRMFFYLPLEHSESLDDQARSLALHKTIDFEKYAQDHYDIIERFGRFPHRNEVLGRTSTPEELAFLADGGFKG